jgi:flagellar assembly protein FliH
MSSSPSRAQIEDSTVEAPVPKMQPFPYESVVGQSGDARIGQLRRGNPGVSSTANEAGALARDAQLRAQGRQEGLAEGRKTFEEQLAREHASLTSALAQFTRDRATYFQKVEAEVIQLALAIARKILHRESQLDPLLLAGIARVALEKIDGATGVVLRIHPQNAAEWRRCLSTQLDPADLPQIVEDPAQPIDRCTLETSMGTAVIGLEVQLKEIEQGLMDLLAARPESAR